MFALSALAVDKEIVGNEREGELICWAGELSCCVAAAAKRAAVAVCVSVLVLGEGEKRLVNFFTLGEDARRGSSCFSVAVVVAVMVVVVVLDELLANGFRGLLDIVGHVWELSSMRARQSS